MFSKRSGLIATAMLLIGVFAFAVTSATAGGYNLAGVGAKGLAMAGAYHGLADDWSAPYWNPAGLYGQTRQFGIDAKVLLPKVTFTPNVPADVLGYANGVEGESASNSYPAASFGAVYPMNGALTFGLAVFAPSAIGAEWVNLFKGPPAGYGNTVPYPEQGWFSDVKVIDIHPSAAYRLTDKFRVGLGVGINYGSVTLRSPKVQPNGIPVPPPFNNFYIDASLKGSGWGFGYNIGTLYDLNDEWTLGLSFRGPVTIPLEGSIEQEMILPKNDPIRAGLPPMYQPLFAGGSLKAEPDAKADFPLPADLGLGVAWNASDRLILTGDVTWTNWGSVKDIDIDAEGTGPTGAPAQDSKLILRYEDTYKISLGGEYALEKWSDMRLRFGYYFDPSPIPDGSMRPSITDTGDKHNISLGFQFRPTARIGVEGFYEGVFTGTRAVASEDMDGDGAPDNLAGDWSLGVTTIGVALVYSF